MRDPVDKFITSAFLISESYMPSSLNIDLLQAFVVVQQTGGFTQAADALGRTQPAVSLQIKRLEERIGTRVFERSRKGDLALTPAGLTLLDYAHRILSLHDEAIASLTVPDVKSYLRLGILEELSHSRLPAILRSFSKVFPAASPQVRVALSYALLTELYHGRLDLAVVASEPAGQNGIVLWSEPLVWVRSSTVPVLYRPPLPFVLLPDPSFYRRFALQALTSAGIKWTQACISSTMAGARASVIAGLGMSVMGQSEVTEGLRVVGPETGLPRLPFVQLVIYYRTREFEPAAQAFAAHLRHNIS
jgi:DNA-binding transcriptional LysR family regulator